MNYIADFDYKTILKPSTSKPVNLFKQRVDHWIDMLQRQESAIKRENEKLSRASGWVTGGIDFKIVDALKERCLNAGKFLPKAFDPAEGNRLAKIGELILEKPEGAQSKWGFYCGLLMSSNPARNPALYMRLEPATTEVSLEIRLPALALLPDQIKFSPHWHLVEGNKQDVYAIAILSAYDFSTNPSCEEVAQGLITILLSSTQN